MVAATSAIFLVIFIQHFVYLLRLYRPHLVHFLQFLYRGVHHRADAPELSQQGTRELRPDQWKAFEHVLLLFFDGKPLPPNAEPDFVVLAGLLALRNLVQQLRRVLVVLSVEDGDAAVERDGCEDAANRILVDVARGEKPARVALQYYERRVEVRCHRGELVEEPAVENRAEEVLHGLPFNGHVVAQDVVADLELFHLYHGIIILEPHHNARCLLARVHVNYYFVSVARRVFHQRHLRVQLLFRNQFRGLHLPERGLHLALLRHPRIIKRLVASVLRHQYYHAALALPPRAAAPLYRAYLRGNRLVKHDPIDFGGVEAFLGAARR